MGPPYRETVSTTIVFETHATTVDNESGHSTGWLPGELSPLGRRQARELGLRRRDDGIAAVFTSDLARAVQSVQLAFDNALPVLHDWRLRECDYGRLNGAPHALVADIRSRYQQDPYPGGESWEQAVRRVAGFLRDVPSRWQGARILVVGHLATRFAFEHVMGAAPLAELLSRQETWRPGWEYLLPAPTGQETTP